tara:strand:- start:7875 stop:8033 length:159 start_codon:yes stop_codon:yes gene_type:complete
VLLHLFKGYWPDDFLYSPSVLLLTHTNQGLIRTWFSRTDIFVSRKEITLYDA